MIDKINLLDADSLLYTHCWVCRESNLLDDYINSIDNHIKEIFFRSDTPLYLIFLTDAPKNVRNAYAKQKEYKGQRKKREKPKFFYDLKNHLINYWKAYSYYQLEADDLCLIAQKKYGRERCVISSIDKDLRQVAGNFYCYKNMKMFTVTEVEATYNLWSQVLMGDSGDNIPGIKGLGEKTAAKLLQDEGVLNYPSIVLSTYMNTYPTAEAVERFNETFQLVYIRDTFESEDFALPELNEVLLEPVPSEKNEEENEGASAGHNDAF